MPNATHTPLIAGCGHEYAGYTHNVGWPRCPKCMTTTRLNMQIENGYRAWLLASTRTTPKSYSIPRAIRLAVYERDEWTCQLCLEPVDSTLDYQDIWSATLDHIICRSWTDEPDHSAGNLRLAHRWCNSVRGDESHHSPDVLRAA